MHDGADGEEDDGDDAERERGRVTILHEMYNYYHHLLGNTYV